MTEIFHTPLTLQSRVLNVRTHSHGGRIKSYPQCLSNGTPWKEKVLLAKKDCNGLFSASLNDQYTDGGNWSIDDKERCHIRILNKKDDIQPRLVEILKHTR